MIRYIYEIPPAVKSEARTSRLVLSGSDVRCTVVVTDLGANGGRNSLHSHTVDEIIHIVTGKGYCRLGNETVNINDGSVLYVKANVIHQQVNEASEQMRMFCVFVPSLSDSELATIFMSHHEDEGG
ncbi:Cupin domain protein [Acididesulfobacillus acetoxydans]|uniref:Cupin domain protein n=1 Tax=Acididesulfobacillus acetoxydans TaxID=1561005 RepID=A0A8S0Y4K1_9FIRM|nr:Cupin domain protein [Acididesulfobacillus acetoxydans]CEJ08707.1 RmlC-like cupin domain [Acididesulfobacillus acetoxydans]